MNKYSGFCDSCCSNDGLL